MLKSWHHSEMKIAKALQNNSRKAYLFALKHEYKMHHQVQSAIKAGNKEIKKNAYGADQ